VARIVGGAIEHKVLNREFKKPGRGAKERLQLCVRLAYAAVRLSWAAYPSGPHMYS